MTQAERITALEIEVKQLTDIIRDMNGKLDSLISLRDKGAGAFWLGTTLFGTSIIGFIYALTHWTK